jgi:hypothetical protein
MNARSPRTRDDGGPTRVLPGGPVRPLSRPMARNSASFRRGGCLFLRLRVRVPRSWQIILRAASQMVRQLRLSVRVRQI